jgi:hypothetical protein
MMTRAANFELGGLSRSLMVWCLSTTAGFGACFSFLLLPAQARSSNPMAAKVRLNGVPVF